VKKDDLIAHHKNALRLLDKLGIVKSEHVPRSANKMANALANLIATLVLGAKESCTERLIGRPKDSNEEEVKLVSVYEIDEED